MKSAIIYKNCTFNRAEIIIFRTIKHAILRQERQTTPHRAPTWSGAFVKDKRFIYGHSRVLFMNICVNIIALLNINTHEIPINFRE